jgi:AtzE family amidohydrolase
MDPSFLPAWRLAEMTRAGEIGCVELLDHFWARVERLDGRINAVVVRDIERARARAKALDAGGRAGAGPLFGVPMTVKESFDLAGHPSTWGFEYRREHRAEQDALPVQRLEAAGAVVFGKTNVPVGLADWQSYNPIYGGTSNPWNLGHTPGGSSGGSSAAMAAGFGGLELGSDIGGSIRVPAHYCGLFGHKPTYGRLSRAGVFPFVASLDHVGPIARSAGDLALAYDAMLARDEADPAQADKPSSPVSPALEEGARGLKIARLGGYFTRSADESALAAVDAVARALKADRTAELADAEAARAGAYLISMVEGGALHLDRLRTRALDFDPDVRDRLIAGAMLPGAWSAQAQKFRRRFRAEALALFRDADILLAPATPCRAPRLGQKTFVLDGKEMLVRPNLGLFTQPISFIGLPVVAAPVWTEGERLPIGVQIIAAPWREDLVLRAAWALEQGGVVRAPVANLSS